MGEKHRVRLLVREIASCLDQKIDSIKRGWGWWWFVMMMMTVCDDDDDDDDDADDDDRDVRIKNIFDDASHEV